MLISLSSFLGGKASTNLGAIHLRFVSVEEILAKAPERTRNSSNPLRIPCDQTLGTKCVVPDGVFGLEYFCGGKKSYRFFALEVDRATMPVVRKRCDQTSYLAKLLSYRDVLASEMHKTHLGLPNLFVLTVTTSERHLQSMLSAFQRQIGASTVFLFKSMGEEAAWSDRAQPDVELLSRPWRRVGQAQQSIGSF